MRLAITFICVLVIAGFFHRCEIGYDCVYVDEMPEFDTLTSFEGVQLQPVLFNPDDVFGEDSVNIGDQFIINDNNTYQEWKTASDGCAQCFFPEIDFNTHTLVGIYYTLTCNEVPLVRILKNGSNYRHIVKASDVTKCNFNFCENFTFAWVTIPKDINASFTFEKVQAYNDCECD